jgi:hypothetical protein
MRPIGPVDHVAREKHDSGRLGGLIRFGALLSPQRRLGADR